MLGLQGIRQMLQSNRPRMMQSCTCGKSCSTKVVLILLHAFTQLPSLHWLPTFQTFSNHAASCDCLLMNLYLSLDFTWLFKAHVYLPVHIIHREANSVGIGIEFQSFHQCLMKRRFVVRKDWLLYMYMCASGWAGPPCPSNEHQRFRSGHLQSWLLWLCG